jgi:hypothetical protein
VPRTCVTWPPRRRRVALLAIPLLTAASLTLVPATADAAAPYGICVASITLSFTLPVTQPLPPSTGPLSTSTGNGTISLCVFPGGGATTGTLTYALTGNLTCTSASNITGTLTISLVDGNTSTATITAGRFGGDQIKIANIRDPLALLTCLATGLSTASGITSLTFTQL